TQPNKSFYCREAENIRNYLGINIFPENEAFLITDWEGYQWLFHHYKIYPVQEVPVTSEIGTTRRTIENDSGRREIYLSVVRPDPTLAGHLTFAIKHEGVHLEFLYRLFRGIPKQELEAWINGEPTGQYARRAGFLYEWL